MNLTPLSPSQNCHVVRWHCTAEGAESKRRVAKVKADFSVIARLIRKLADEFRKENTTRLFDYCYYYYY